MKIIETTNKKIFDIQFNKIGENQDICPVCSKDRKKNKAKPFSFNTITKVGYCMHCNTSFVEYNNTFVKKEYIKPINKITSKIFYMSHIIDLVRCKQDCEIVIPINNLHPNLTRDFVQYFANN